MAISQIDTGLFQSIQERPLTPEELNKRLNILIQQIDQSIKDIKEPEGVDETFVLSKPNGSQRSVTFSSGQAASSKGGI